MKALSLWQPWASAIALGHKRIETRHWSTSYRGPLLIHAARRWTAEERGFAAVEHTLGRLPSRLPLGAFVAVARLVDIRPTEELYPHISAIERLYGNYEPGRFGWMLEDIRPLPDPVGFKGHQGLFNAPDHLLCGDERAQPGLLL
jgi:hypothetical protein